MKIVQKFNKWFEEDMNILKFHVELENMSFRCDVSLDYLEDRVHGYNQNMPLDENLAKILNTELLPNLDDNNVKDGVLTLK